jgi:hypothetical protein
MGIFGANYGANYDLTLDTTDPTITIQAPLDLSTVGSPFTVSGISADNVFVSKVEVQVDSDALQLATGTTSWSINLTGVTNGSHTITAKVTDSSGNTATDIITVEVLVLGGSSGGIVKKSVGHQLTDLGPRPHAIQRGESIATTLLRPLNKSKSKLVITVNGESVCKVIPYFGGVSTSQLLIKVKSESTAKLYFKGIGESWGILHPSVTAIHNIKKTEKLSKAIKTLTYLSMMSFIDNDN